MTLGAFSLFIPGSHAVAEEPPRLSAQLISDVDTIQPGQTFRVALRIEIPPDWHIYWKKPGDAGLPTQIHLDLPKDVSLSDWFWLKPEIIQESGDIVTIGYRKEAVMLAEGKLSSKWPIGTPLAIKGSVSWLACKLSCIPGRTEFTLSIPVTPGRKEARDNSSVIDEIMGRTLGPAQDGIILAEYQDRRVSNELLQTVGLDTQSQHPPLWIALLFAWIGGVILNIMPCVLPVLSLKALRIARQKEISPQANQTQAVLYTIGVVVSFTLLAAVIVLLKTAGEQIGWGFQFQEPWFLISMAVVVFTFALSLFGAFEFSVLLPQNVEKWTHQNSWFDSFAEGILAALLATPCTAPLLGPAIGYAFSQPAWVIFLTFWLIGFGLAFPFLVLAMIPRMTAILPKPGPWMVGVWILIVFRMSSVNGAQTKRWSVTITGFAIIIFWILFVLAPAIRPGKASNTRPPADAAATEGWERFSFAGFKKALNEQRLIFIDFTADWCLTCQLNKKTVLNSPVIHQAFIDNDVVVFVADWTRRDENITRLMKQLGRSGVPIYVFFKNGDASHPILLPEVLTEKMVLTTLDRLKRNTN